MPKLEINSQPSRYLAILLLSTHIIALLAIMLAALPFYVRMSASTVVVLSLLYNISHYIWAITPHAVSQAVLMNDSEWLVKWQGSYVKANLLTQQSYLSAWLIVLNFQLAEDNIGKRVNLLILPDSIAADNLRQLRTRLLN